MKITDEYNSKERILHAAIKLFAQKGFEAASTREICKEAKINLCMISYYFGGKQELYNAIINDLIEKQTNYARNFIDFNSDVMSLSKNEQINLLFNILDKFVDFFYSNVTNDLVVFLIKEQQKPSFIAKSPAIDFISRLIAAIFDKEINDREIIFKTVFIVAQINSPCVFPAFSLRKLKQKEFTDADKELIKTNVKLYVKTLLNEANIKL